MPDMGRFEIRCSRRSNSSSGAP